jgi:3-oxoacyl-[acyl-carrier-protein] synthase II
MTALAITGWSMVAPSAPAHVEGMFEEPLPSPSSPVLVDFDVRTRLGRKGTSFYDRATALAVVACGEALGNGGVVVDDVTRTRIGVVLGTTLGSFKSTSDYSRETLVQEKPYLVNPVLFPNTVMNCAAGQAAIRFGLRGVNATIAGGPLAFHHALRYAANALHRAYAETMLVGAVEEFSPHRAWNTHLTSGGVAGEGAAVFVVERPDTKRPTVAEVLATATGFGWRDAGDAALTGCVRRILATAGVCAADVSLVVVGDGDPEYLPAVEALGHRPERVCVTATHGSCDAASGALALALALGHHGLAVLTARTADGGVGAALVRCP